MWYGRRSQLGVDRGPCTPFSALSFDELSGTDRNYRRNAGTSSSQGTGIVRSTATIVPVRKKGALRVQGVVTVGPHQESRTLPSHRIVARPQELRTQSPHHFRIRHPERRRVDLVTLYPVGNRGPARLATRLDPTPAGLPGRLQNYDDPVSQALTPSMPTNSNRVTRWDSTTAVSSTTTTSRTWRGTTSSITMRCRTQCPCSSAAFSTNPVLHGRVRLTR